MHEEIVSAREFVRHLRKYINKLKRTKKPLIIGRYGKPEIVAMDINTYYRWLSH